MSRKSLHDKLAEKKLLDIKQLIYLVASTSFVFSFLILLFNFEITSGFSLSIILMACSWGFAGLLRITHTLDRIVERPEKIRRALRQYSILLVIVIVISQALAIYLIFENNFNLLIVEFFFLFELMFYITYTVTGIIPSNRIGLWLAVLFCIGLFVSIFLLPFADYYSGLAVEIIGAFIGVFAAITLGEAFKEIESIREGRKLRILVIEELLEVERQLENGICDQVPIPIWVAALADDSILKLQSDFRKAATQAHKSIHYFNLDAHSQQHREEALKTISEVIE